MGKRYFWLKLKDDFFSQKEIKMLRRISGGDTFTIIYLKILLLSIKNDGKVYFDGVASNMVEEIALEIDEEAENVQITFNYLQQKGLLIFNSDDEVELSNIHSMIGSETAAASRMRKSRSKKEIEEKRNNVTPQLHHSYTEIEKEIEKEIEINKDILSGKPDYLPAIKEIIEYLNQKTGSNYRVTTKATQTKIKTRLAEGFSVDDFKRVIDIKSAEWLNDANMSAYLRPETLFGTKFESYCQQKGPVRRQQFQNYQQPKRKEELPDWERIAAESQPTPDEQAALQAELDRKMAEFLQSDKEEKT